MASLLPWRREAWEHGRFRHATIVFLHAITFFKNPMNILYVLSYTSYILPSKMSSHHYEKDSIPRVLAMVGIHSALTEMLRSHPELYDEKNDFGDTILSFCLLGMHEKIIQDALKNLKKDHLNSKGYIVSPLCLAVLIGRMICVYIQ